MDSMNNEEAFNLLMEAMKDTPNERLDNTFIGALNVSSEQVGVVNLAFWLVYMAETDLDDILKKGAEHSDSIFSAEINTSARKMIIDGIKGYTKQDADLKTFIAGLNVDEENKLKILGFINKNYNEKRVSGGVDDMPYFIDKIKVYEFFFGKSERTKMLYKINDLRNALSHNKIDTLSYNSKSLFLRETKESLIRDYFETSYKEDGSKSQIWNALTEEQKEEIKRMSKDNPIDNI